MMTGLCREEYKEEGYWGIVFCALRPLVSYDYVWLEVGYGLSWLMLVLYFTWETSPIHRSRKTEKWYLFTALAVLQVCGEVFALIEGSRHSDPYSAPHLIIRRILFVYMCAHNTQLIRYPPCNYHLVAPPQDEGETAKQAAAPWEPTHLAIRVSEELESLVDYMLDMSCMMNSGFVFGDVRSAVILLYVIFMVGDFTQCQISFSATLERVLGISTNAMLASVLLRLLRNSWRLGPYRRQVHKLISTLVASQDPIMVQYVISKISLVNLMEVAMWETVLLLTNSALEEDLLTITSKTLLVIALQRKGLKSKNAQTEVKRLLLSCEGSDLTVLKNSIDSGGDYHNLYRLIYFEIPDGAVRREILDHFTLQARYTREERSRGLGVKVISDVDDTLYSSGGTFPAGCDQRFPKHEVYPGCLTLLRILDKSFSKERPYGNVVFLSARPHVYKGYSEDVSFTLFKRLVAAGRLHSLPTLLSGNLRHSMWALAAYPCQGVNAWRPVGEVKLETYKNFQHLYKEYDFVFLGDNGQGDLLAGQKMLKDRRMARRRGAFKTARCSTRPSRSPALASPPQLTAALRSEPKLLAVLMHQVMDNSRCLALEGEGLRDNDWPANLAEQGVFLHRTYVGAALALRRHCGGELVTAEQLQQVAVDAIAEFDRMRLKYTEWGDRWQAAEQDLRDDLAAASAELEEAGLPPLNSLKCTRELHNDTDSRSWELQVRSLFTDPSLVAAGHPSESSSASARRQTILELCALSCGRRPTAAQGASSAESVA